MEAPVKLQIKKTVLYWFIGSLLIFLALSSGHAFYSDDENVIRMYEGLKLDSAFGASTDFGNMILGSTGRYYSKADIGVVAFGLPFYFAGSILDRFIAMPSSFSIVTSSWAETMASLSMLIPTALAVLFTALALCFIGVNRRFAGFIAFLMIFGSPALFASRALLSTNLSVAGLSLVFLAYSHAYSVGAPTRKDNHLLGIGLLVCLLSRPTGVLLLPFAILAWWQLSRFRIRNTAAPVLWCLAAFCLKLSYNYYRMGYLSFSGYKGEADYLFTRNLLETLVCTTIVPRWSLFFNFPVVTLVVLPILACLHIGSNPRTSVNRFPRAFMLWMLAYCASLAILYGKYVVPVVFASRYWAELVFVTSFFGIAYIWSKTETGLKGTAPRILSVVLAIAGTCMNLPSTLMPWSRIRYFHDTMETPPRPWENFSYYWAVPTEASDFLSQFAQFPRPDWLAYYLFPGSWRVIVPLMCFAGTLLLLAPAAKSGKTVVATLMLALIIPNAGIIHRAMNQRSFLGSTGKIQWLTPPNNMRPLSIDFFELNGELVSDHLVEIPPQCQAPMHAAYSTELQTTFSLSGQVFQKKLNAGSGDPKYTYNYSTGERLKKLDKLTNVWLSNVRGKVELGNGFGPGPTYYMTTIISNDGEKRSASLGSFCFPGPFVAEPYRPITSRVQLNPMEMATTCQKNASIPLTLDNAGCRAAAFYLPFSSALEQHVPDLGAPLRYRLKAGLIVNSDSDTRTSLDLHYRGTTLEFGPFKRGVNLMEASGRPSEPQGGGFAVLEVRQTTETVSYQILGLWLEPLPRIW